MNRLAYPLLIGIAISLYRPVFAYELATHGRMTNEAFNTSRLATDSQLLNDLGFSKDTLLGEDYFDISGATIQPRSTKPFESSFKRMPEGVDPRSLSGWLMRGAIREDDLGSVAGIQIGTNPHDDPYGDINRVFNHFFDPYNNQALTYVSGAKKAPDWAAGSNDIFSQPNTPDTARRNHFTVFDARESLYRALTLQGKNADGSYAPLDVNGAWNTAKQEQVRKAYWATTFRALGDILHLNQDMAQPQHTRNEPHSGKGGYLVEELLTGHSSVMEDYIDARATGAKSYTMDGQEIVPTPLFNAMPTYAIPTFNKYSDYWSTRPGSGSLTGKGLADYSNHGFYTQKYNFGNSTYTYPAGGTKVTVMQPDGTSKGFLQVAVKDEYTAGNDSILMSTRTSWADFQEFFGFSPTYFLTKTNYDAMANLLIPRAVGYSAGLINYFFRGKMEISLPDEGVYGVIDHNDSESSAKDTGGFTKIKLKIKNITPKGAGIEPMTTGGKLAAVVKFHRNTCYKSDLSGEYGSPGIDWNVCRVKDEEIVVSSPVSAPSGINSDPSQLTFSFPTPIPINATDLFLQVVYRGPLGDETDAVAVATKDISEPTYIYNFLWEDQYKYDYYWPVIDISGVIGTSKSYADWCTKGDPPGFPSVDACNQSMGGATRKIQFSPTANPIPGYDPATASVPQNEYSDTQEPPLSPLATLAAPVGTLARVAVLSDTTPANIMLEVGELNDTTHAKKMFMWRMRTALATTNQKDPVTGNLTPSVKYLPGRGVYLPDVENEFLIKGDADPMPPLVLTPSQISPNW